MERYRNEWLQLKAGVKRAALVRCAPDDLKAAGQWFIESGFAAQPLAQETNRRFDRGDREAILIVGATDDERQRAEALYVQERLLLLDGGEADNTTRELAMLLGYPSCCVEAYLRLRSHRDSYLLRAAYHATQGRIDPQVLLLGRSSPTWLQHTPCSLNCSASQTIAEQVRRTARQLDPRWADEIDVCLHRPVFYLDDGHYLRLDGNAISPNEFRVQSLHLTDNESQRLDSAWLARFSIPGLLKREANSAWSFEPENGEAWTVHPADHPVKPLWITPQQPHPFRQKPSVLLLETYPNEHEQMLSGFFPRLYAGDLTENGIRLQYLEYHHPLGQTDLEEQMITDFLERIVKEEVTQVYFFRTFPRKLLTSLAQRFPDLPRILIDTATPSRAFGITHMLPVLDRARFIHTVLGIAADTPPNWLKPVRDGEVEGSVWEGFDSDASPDLMVDPTHPLNLRVSPTRLNPNVTRLPATQEIMARPGCPYQTPCKQNPAFAGLETDRTPFVKGCSYCTGRTPWWRPVSAKRQAASLIHQVRDLLAYTDGPRSARILDQAVLPAMPYLLDFAEQEGVSNVTWQLDLRVPDVLAHGELLRKLLEKAKAVRHRLDLFCLGFENFSQPELDRFNKGVTVQDNRQAITLLDDLAKAFPSALSHSHGASGFILFTPWTTLADLEVNRAALKETDFSRFRAGAIFTKLRLYKDAPLYRLAQRDGLAIDDYPEERWDASLKFGYSPEEPWRFQHDETAAVYRLLEPFGATQKRIDEPALLALALDWVRRSDNQPIDSEAFTQAATACVQERESLEEFEEPGSKGPQDIPSSVRLALAKAEEAVRDRPGAFTARMELAARYISVNRLNDALGQFLAARKLNPAHPDPLLRVSEMLAKLGKHEESRNVLDQIARRFADDDTVLERVYKLKQTLGPNPPQRP